MHTFLWAEMLTQQAQHPADAFYLFTVIHLIFMISSCIELNLF